MSLDIGIFDIVEELQQRGWVFEEFLSSGTWSHPKPGVLIPVFVLAVGGGGSGRRASSGVKAGGSGGMIAWRRVWVDNDVVVTIGAGGVPTNADNQDGNAGGETSFGDYVRARGGAGGTNVRDPFLVIPSFAGMYARGGVSASEPAEWVPGFGQGGTSVGSPSLGSGGGGASYGDGINWNSSEIAPAANSGAGSASRSGNNTRPGGSGRCHVYYQEFLT